MTEVQSDNVTKLYLLSELEWEDFSSFPAYLKSRHKVLNSFVSSIAVPWVHVRCKKRKKDIKRGIEVIAISNMAKLGSQASLIHILGISSGFYLEDEKRVK